MKPLLITMGDPVGVGPELIVKALLEGALESGGALEVVGDVAVLCRAGKLFERPGQVLAQNDRLTRIRFGERELLVRAGSQLPAAALRYGEPDVACGRAMIDYVDIAVARCRAGQAAGLVTGPINKAAVHAAGCSFLGHTELLAERCGSERVVMMLAGERLRVCLVTTHMALKEVPAHLSHEQILQTLRIVDQDLRCRFALERPRLAVLALNPHAGEDGLFGDEEQRVIAPAIRAACREGIAADGPHSADTLFHFAIQGSCDAVICMYHDQGLIPLKLLHFDDAVNITLGLPIIRTSVDHGTAYDLAGSARANTASLAAAVRLARRMADESA